MKLRPFALRTARLATLAALALAPVAAGCDDIGSNEDNVTDVKQSKVKNQSIGNCWVYASVGWAESLHLTHTGAELNLSESWISYWHWYEEIAGGPGNLAPAALLEKGQISTGGWFGLAAELMRRYGVMDEGIFIPEEGEAARSARQSSALAAINESLKNGKLKDASARKNRKLVREELDKAWGLSASTIAIMNDTFGADVSRSFASTGVAPAVDSGLRLPKDIPVGTNISLSDAIGAPSSSFNILQRKGKYAWNEERYPTSASSRRTLLAKAQKAMHEGMPVIMVWFVDFAAMDSQNRFMAPPATPGRQGGHMTVMEDYQINDVPGFGTLKAGELVTDPAALEAALAPEAKIEFIRIKNSWGTSLAPNESGEEFRGYHDIYAAYLDGPLVRCTESNGDKCGIKTNTSGLTGLVLPPAAFVTDAKAKPGTCEVDLCKQGPKLSSTTCSDGDKKACIDIVCEMDSFCCNSSWDNQCVSEAVDACSLTCTQ
jgi:hypothetical protein